MTKRRSARRDPEAAKQKSVVHKLTITKLPRMNAVEFTTSLTGGNALAIPPDAVERLPKGGRARVIVLTEEKDGDATWQRAAYEQFLRDDPPEDSVYDRVR